MAGILDSLMGMLGPQVIAPVASQLGESTETVQRGLQTGSAAMLAGLITNPANTSGALSSIMSNPAS
jgi:OmpA-OmpF porin, OOP family